MERKYEIRLEAAVDRGAKLLDEKVPDWPTRIDPELLELSSPWSCVLGQTFAHVNGVSTSEDEDYSTTPYMAGLRALGLNVDDGVKQSDSWFGFEAPGFSSTDEEYSRLTELWLIEAKARLDAGIALHEVEEVLL